jgi:hypothetical protein
LRKILLRSQIPTINLGTTESSQVLIGLALCDATAASIELALLRTSREIASVPRRNGSALRLLWGTAVCPIFEQIKAHPLDCVALSGRVALRGLTRFQHEGDVP